MTKRISSLPFWLNFGTRNTKRHTGAAESARNTCDASASSPGCSFSSASSPGCSSSSDSSSSSSFSNHQTSQINAIAYVNSMIHLDKLFIFILPFLIVFSVLILKGVSAKTSLLTCLLNFIIFYDTYGQN